jgi:hypothetical protein
MYEHKSHPLSPKKLFIRRLLSRGPAGLAVIAISLGSGVLGYHFTEKLSWLDSLLNASMILGGMWPAFHRFLHKLHLESPQKRN